MKKRILSALLALVFLLALLPAAASAGDPVFITEFFPQGISAPGAPYLRMDVDEDNVNGDRIDMWVMVSPELRKLGSAVDLWEEQNPDAGSAARGRLGVNGYNVRLQVDGRVDGGPWQYNSEWNDFGFSAAEGTSRGCFEASRYVDIRSAYEDFQLSTVTHGSSDDGKELGFLKDILIPFTNKYDDTNYHYDLTNHTLSVRCRIILYYDELDGGERHVLYSDWGPETSIGKNGTQKDLPKPNSIEAPTLSDFSLYVEGDREPEIKFFITIPDSVYAGEMYCDAVADIFEPYRLDAQIRVNGGEWTEFHIANRVWMYDSLRGGVSHSDYPFTADSQVEIRVRISCERLGLTSPWSNVVGTKPSFIASNWALEELAEADAMGLIPDSLRDADLTKPITRAEFAAVSVKVFEALTTIKAPAGTDDPFTDTDDPEVLKAYGLGITNGMSDTTFEPDRLLNREQAATMLTRVFKKVNLSGWTLDTDGTFNAQFKTMFEMPELFGDDQYISSWAKDSVYFMAANGIIKGMGNDENGKPTFAPRDVTESQKAIGYANATRQQALLIAVRMAKNLG